MSVPESLEDRLPCKCASDCGTACSWSLCVMRIYGECKQSGGGAVNIYTTESPFFGYSGMFSCEKSNFNMWCCNLQFAAGSVQLILKVVSKTRTRTRDRCLCAYRQISA